MAGRSNIILGKAGEEIAEKFLGKLHYKILHKNLKTPFGEIDLVALDKNVIVFVEVKTRISTNFGPPEHSVTLAKKKTIIKNAAYYMKRFGFSYMDARIDVISINMDETGRLQKLNHIKSAIWIE